MARKPAKKPRKRTTPKARKPQANPSAEYKVTGPYSPEQRAAIVERMRARHSPATIQGTIERPDFHLTTDIRATSDPLWRHLFTFRRRLIQGGTYTPAEWHEQIIAIRDEAHVAGLRPQFGNVEWIPAYLSEVCEEDPRSWQDEPPSWSKFVLVNSGEDGWLELHDLLDGFADPDKRIRAIVWAESWMNARERQLCQPAAVDPHAIERAAERAAQNVARVFGGGGGGDAPSARIGQHGPAKRESKTWQRVRAVAEEKVKRGGWPGLNTLARLCDCSPATLKKAVKRSLFLTAREAEHESHGRKARATALTVPLLDSTAQTTEPDPELAALIRESEADNASDPSPFDVTSRKRQAVRRA